LRVAHRWRRRTRQAHPADFCTTSATSTMGSGNV
jgi:hypothetical protein